MVDAAQGASDFCRRFGFIDSLKSPGTLMAPVGRISASLLSADPQ
jgi:hypothetical protein